MAVYDLEEQEQLDELKTWWKQYGNLVTNLVLAVVVAAAAWQGWNWWQRDQAMQSSSIYAALQQAAIKGDAKQVRERAGELIDKFSRTPYAGMGALISARIHADSGDIKTAQAQLSWAAETASDPGLRDLARLRLALVLIDEKAYDEAAKQLAIEPAAPFLARHAEIKGDLLAAQGKVSEARATYEGALGKLDAAVVTGSDSQSSRRNYNDVLRAKIDLVGSGAGK